MNNPVGSAPTLKMQALKLRKQGKSYRAIEKEIGVARSTLSFWFNQDPISAHGRKKLEEEKKAHITRNITNLAIINRARWARSHAVYRQAARDEFPKLVLNRLFVTGVTIYWGEGDKKATNSIVRVANIDPNLLRTFTQFLTQSCQVPLVKIRVSLLIYPDHSEEQCREFWSQALDISKTQFIKTQHIMGRSSRSRIKFGVCTVQAYSRELKECLLEWIRLLGDNVQDAGIA